MEINFLFFRKWLIAVFNPIYQLTLDGRTEELATGKPLYLFKQYGSHDFVSLSYTDICKNIHIMHSINPFDMKRIHIDEHNAAEKNSCYRVVNYLRNNEYIVSNGEKSEKHSGEFICKNLDQFGHFNLSDLVNIAYAEGLAMGRKISHNITHKNSIRINSETDSFAQTHHDNVVNFPDKQSRNDRY